MLELRKYISEAVSHGRPGARYYSVPKNEREVCDWLEKRGFEGNSSLDPFAYPNSIKNPEYCAFVRDEDDTGTGGPQMVVVAQFKSRRRKYKIEFNLELDSPNNVVDIKLYTGQADNLFLYGYNDTTMEDLLEQVEKLLDTTTPL
jgi:hypothetical protein